MGATAVAMTLDIEPTTADGCGTMNGPVRVESIDDQNSCATSGLGESIRSCTSSAQASQELLQQTPLTPPPPLDDAEPEKQPVSLTASAVSTSSNPNKSWLLRLFESKLFDASMAMVYMFNSKEPGVLGYIGNKLFTYSEADLDFYLPQMVNMYVMYHEVAEVLHPYLIHR
jgi:hypothetical protein